MSKAKSLAVNAYTIARAQAEIASGVLVIACAAALIMAGPPLPL